VNPFLDHASRMLIQLNWVVIAYNINIVNRMLIIHESSIGAFLLTTLFTLLLPLHIICFLYFLSTNHKCTQPYYFFVLYKTSAQKVKMDWNSSTRSFRMCAAPVAVPVVF
jgi:hypothetical protein